MSLEQFIPGALVSVAVALVGALVKRSIDSLASTLAGHGAKLDKLSEKDSLIEIQLAEMRVRLAQVEASILSMQQNARREMT